MLMFFFLYTKLRNKKKNYHLNLKQFTVLLLNYLQNALKKSSILINDLGTQLENFGVGFLTVFNISLKNNAFLINKNISLHNISLTEETLSNLSKTKKTLKHKKNNISKTIKPLKGLTSLRGIHFKFKRK